MASHAPFALAFVGRLGCRPVGMASRPLPTCGRPTRICKWSSAPPIQIILWGQIARRLGSADQLVILKKPFDVAEVLQLASAMTEKWRLAREALQRMRDLEGLVRERTRDLESAHAELVAANRRASQPAGGLPNPRPD